MTDKTKKVIKIAGICGVVLGSVGIYFGGGSEGYTVEIVGGVFSIIGIVIALLNKD